VVPEPSPKLYPAVKPDVDAVVAALAVLEYALRFPAASVARTR
jgi:hypothetical protein